MGEERFSDYIDSVYHCTISVEFIECRDVPLNFNMLAFRLELHTARTEKLTSNLLMPSRRDWMQQSEQQQTPAQNCRAFRAIEATFDGRLKIGNYIMDVFEPSTYTVGEYLPPNKGPANQQKTRNEKQA